MVNFDGTARQRAVHAQVSRRIDTYRSVRGSIIPDCGSRADPISAGSKVVQLSEMEHTLHYRGLSKLIVLRHNNCYQPFLLFCRPRSFFTSHASSTSHRIIAHEGADFD
ncbi:hypothetical protein BHE74_00040332 [Ensete ventricosum]|nr:hypothetical protein BHE74_00040332 [Ensete ventricosum]